MTENEAFEAAMKRSFELITAALVGDHDLTTDLVIEVADDKESIAQLAVALTYMNIAFIDTISRVLDVEREVFWRHAVPQLVESVDREVNNGN